MSFLTHVVSRLLRIGLTFIAVIATLLLGVVGFLIFLSRPYSKSGPASPMGYQVVVTVSDCGWGPGADFYADVKINAPDGSQLFNWEDPHGQQSAEGIEKLLKT